ncbi:MAG: hypothetical protein EPN93_11175 [Spirochaetes bacterium]|nr:MAG: hypothetical protein EPN93_11175 [Spirochaetota bacterium]
MGIAPSITTRTRVVLCLLALVLFPVVFQARGFAAGEDASYLADRGTGIPTSMFGSYIRRGDFLFYPFYEYYYDKKTEYAPEDFGYTGSKTYKAKSWAHEGLIYVAYGFTDWLMVEMEAAVISQRQYKSDRDISAMPDSIRESGIGDVEGQVRWRWFGETDVRPELFSYVETVGPTQKSGDVLIGTPDWEFKFGAGVIKGFGFGTLTLRASFEYLKETNKFESGEYAVEYLKKISNTVRVFLGVEGSQDEVSVIPEIQVYLRENIYLKLNCGFGITPAATDIAPEAGIMFVL